MHRSIRGRIRCQCNAVVTGAPSCRSCCSAGSGAAQRWQMRAWCQCTLNASCMHRLHTEIVQFCTQLCQSLAALHCFPVRTASHPPTTPANIRVTWHTGRPSRDRRRQYCCVVARKGFSQHALVFGKAGGWLRRHHRTAGGSMRVHSYTAMWLWYRYRGIDLSSIV